MRQRNLSFCWWWLIKLKQLLRSPRDQDNPQQMLRARRHKVTAGVTGVEEKEEIHGRGSRKKNIYRRGRRKKNIDGRGNLKKNRIQTEEGGLCGGPDEQHTYTRGKDGDGCGGWMGSRDKDNPSLIIIQLQVENEYPR